jgi:hypothetical protein
VHHRHRRCHEVDAGERSRVIDGWRQRTIRLHNGRLGRAGEDGDRFLVEPICRGSHDIGAYRIRRIEGDGWATDRRFDGFSFERIGCGGIRS